MENKPANIIKIIIYCILFIIIPIFLIFGYFLFSSPVIYSDRLFLLYKDEKNTENVLMIKLSKYKIFPHYYNFKYTASLAEENQKINLKQYGYSSINSAFKPIDFIKKVSNINNANILNENYKLNIEINNKKIEIDLKDMTGDFLINNSLERLTYVNMGTTTIKVDGGNYKANFALNKTVITQDFQSIKAKGTVVFFSDKYDELYYIDNSEVIEGDRKYLSHSWAINKKGMTLKKDVGEKVNLTFEDKKSIILDLKNFNNARIKLNKLEGFNSEDTFYTVVKGELIDDNGEKTITGFSMHYDE